MNASSFFVFLGLLCSVLGYQVKKAPLLTKRPHWLRACWKNDPNFNNCLNDLFVDIFPELAKGIPELNVDPFEPLHLDRVSVSKGSGPITLSGSLFDLQVSGPSNATPIYTQLDLENKHWNFGVELPLLDIKSQYDLKGKILVLPLIGHGACEMKLGGVKTRVTTDINLPKIEGKEVLEINKMNVRFTVGKMKIRLHNLFNGNKVLGQTVNAFINQHALEIISELEENIADNLSVIFTDIINNVFTKIPTDLWILGDEEYEKYQKESS